MINLQICESLMFRVIIGICHIPGHISEFQKDYGEISFQPNSSNKWEW